MPIKRTFLFLLLLLASQSLLAWQPDSPECFPANIKIAFQQDAGEDGSNSLQLMRAVEVSKSIKTANTNEFQTEAERIYAPVKTMSLQISKRELERQLCGIAIYFPELNTKSRDYSGVVLLTLQNTEASQLLAQNDNSAYLFIANEIINEAYPLTGFELEREVNALLRGSVVGDKSIAGYLIPYTENSDKTFLYFSRSDLLVELLLDNEFTIQPIVIYRNEENTSIQNLLYGSRTDIEVIAVLSALIESRQH